jgi:hypothetical protein
VAAAYLKENDTVYITGQLNGHTEPVKVNENQANVQVHLSYDFMFSIYDMYSCFAMRLSELYHCVLVVLLLC